MSGLGISVIGRRPIGALRVPARGPQFATLSTAGAGAFAAVAISKGIMTIAFAGVGAFTAVSGPASGKLQASGVGALSATMAAKSSAAVTSVGIGALAGSLAAIGSTNMSAVGSGAFAPVMRAGVSASTAMQGYSGLNASDAPGSTISFAGTGAFAGVAYAFFADAEVAGPLQEVRKAIVAADPYRATVVLAEDRVYPESTPPSAPVIPNRKRLL